MLTRIWVRTVDGCLSLTTKTMTHPFRSADDARACESQIRVVPTLSPLLPTAQSITEIIIHEASHERANVGVASPMNSSIDRLSFIATILVLLIPIL